MSTKLTFEDFLESTSQELKATASKIHESITVGGYKFAVEKKKQGMFISYKHSKTKHATFNLMSNGLDLQVKVYAENHKVYADFIDKLPKAMEEQVATATQCGRFASPPKCSPNCMGYDVLINGNPYQKCRYSCFLLKADEDSLPTIIEFIEKEKAARG